MDPYYSRPEVSNSDLSELQKYWLPENKFIDLEKAYADGTLIDCMLTERHRVDYFKKRVIDYPYQFSDEDFWKAKEMKKSADKDPMCQMIMKTCAFQRVTIKPHFKITYDGFEFQLPFRCKWDFFAEDFDFSGDFKSTSCTTQKQCEDSVYYFDYDRSRAVYMDLENRSNDILIFISKVNFKIFKVPVKRDSELYKSGKAKYQELSFKYWYLYGDLKLVA